MKKLFILFLSVFCVTTLLKAQDIVDFSSKEAQALIKSFKGEIELMKITKGKNKKAIRQLKAGWRKDPKQIENLLLLAEHFIKNKAYKEAKKVLRLFKAGEKKFVQQYSALYHYYIGLVNSYEESKLKHQYIASLKQFKHALYKADKYKTGNPKFLSDLHNNIGFCYMMAQSHHGSLKDKIYVNKVSSRDTMLARKHFKEALKYNSENKVAKWNLAALEKMKYGELIEVNQNRPVEKDTTTLIEDVELSKENANNIDTITTINQQLDCTVYDFDYLPKNRKILLDKLSKYDEVLLLFDISGSMVAEVPLVNSTPKSRFQIAKNLCLYLLYNLPKNVKVGLLTIGGECDAEPLIKASTKEYEREVLIPKVLSITVPTGLTPLDKNLNIAPELFSKRKKSKTIFFLTDGANTCPYIKNTCELSAEFRENNISVNILSFLIFDESIYEYAIYHCMIQDELGEVYELNPKSNDIVNKTVRVNRSTSRLLPEEMRFILPSQINREPIKEEETTTNESLNIAK